MANPQFTARDAEASLWSSDQHSESDSLFGVTPRELSTAYLLRQPRERSAKRASNTSIRIWLFRAPRGASVLTAYQQFRPGGSQAVSFVANTVGVFHTKGSRFFCADRRKILAHTVRLAGFPDFFKVLGGFSGHSDKTRVNADCPRILLYDTVSPLFGLRLHLCTMFRGFLGVPLPANVQGLSIWAYLAYS